ncbi:branched-chain amino acid ABC transporter permease [Calditerrivibrio nitroreducens]|uniref:Amino acid/amide ABC transporter membrane protein 1, HAAT family n=1 Tax=Calditerrivibrio nitroreducens (strain DSM 19672 / NBRC 101217 / Yu37-1) TaxID=768670 RepID=E4THB0_CALNY|nr:branched-chain amino acid ABC transporter permease [Calditerrivibrio nitroreducens]ADR18804.1 amino acid/amide ABC transporter membrane protein 1, HAAT family [Calditerrivibrio nitroreducens DSM 19672]
MQFLYSGITSGSIYALVAIGYNIIYNTTGLINFAQGEFVVLGGMLMYTTLTMFGVNLFYAFLITFILMFFVGILFERVFLRYVRLKTEINLITVTIALAIILRGIAMVIWGRDSLAVPSYVEEKTVMLAGGSITSQSMVVIVVCFFTAIVLSTFFKYTKYGKAFRACHDDQVASTICGIDVNLIRMLSFAIASLLGALAGAIIAPITFVTYTDGVMSGLKGFSAAILGGMGSFWGGLFGGFLLGIIEAFFAFILPSGFKDAFAFIILLLILFIKPSGLFGKKKAVRV